jgi:hypothetical protein
MTEAETETKAEIKPEDSTEKLQLLRKSCGRFLRTFNVYMRSPEEHKTDEALQELKELYEHASRLYKSFYDEFLPKDQEDAVWSMQKGDAAFLVLFPDGEPTAVAQEEPAEEKPAEKSE